MTRKPPTTEEKLNQAAERALSGKNLVTETKTEELPAEFAAFRGLLRQVVKVERKPAPTDKP